MTGNRLGIKILIAILTVVLLTACLTCFAACNNNGLDDTLVVGTTTQINSLNRLAATGGDHGYNYTMLSSTLAQVPIVYKADGRISSVLCNISAGDDGLSYAFELKDGFFWHDGRAVSVEDLAFTLNKNVGDNTLSVGDNTVTVSLKKLQANFLDGLVSVTIMPKHLLENETADTLTDEKSVIGCGPFKFKARNINSDTLEFERFDKYPYANDVKLNKVIFRVFGSDDTMRLALKAGEIDTVWNYGGGLNADGVDDLKDNANLTLLSYTVKAVPKVLYFNNQKLTDVNVKKAMRKAIDYEKIRRIFGTSASTLPREGFVAPDVLGFDNTSELTRDLAGAKALLKEAGYSESKKFAFNLLVRSDSNDTQYADVLKTDLEETGMIKVELTSIAGAAAWRAYYQAGNHMASLAAVTEAGYNFDAGYATRYLLPTENYVMKDDFPTGNPVSHGNIALGEMGALTEFGRVRQALADAKNNDELAAAAKQYQKYIVDNAPCIALLYDSKVQVVSNMLSGYKVDGTFGILNVQSFTTLEKTK